MNTQEDSGAAENYARQAEVILDDPRLTREGKLTGITMLFNEAMLSQPSEKPNQIENDVAYARQRYSEAIERGDAASQRVWNRHVIELTYLQVQPKKPSDTERLDWLEKTQSGFHCSGYHGAKNLTRFEFDRKLSLREAIDDILLARPPEAEKPTP